MTILLSIALIAAMAAVLYVLVRGVIAMAQGKDVSGEVQQGYMQKRVLYQGAAIIIIFILLKLLQGGRG